MPVLLSWPRALAHSTDEKEFTLNLSTALKFTIRRKNNGVRIRPAEIQHNVLQVLMTRNMVPARIQQWFGADSLSPNYGNSELNRWMTENALLMEHMLDRIHVEIERDADANEVVIEQPQPIEGVALFDTQKRGGFEGLKRALIDAVNQGMSANQRDASFRFEHAWEASSCTPSGGSERRYRGVRPSNNQYAAAHGR